MQNDRNHAVKRFLLLGILFFSAVIPFLNIQLFYEEVQLAPVEFVREFVALQVIENDFEAGQIIQPAIETKSLSVNPWLVLYLTAACVLVLRLISGIFRVSKIIKRAEKQRFQKIILAVVKDFIQPFSFLNKVVLSEKDFNDNKDIVVAHELAHIRYKHAIDLMVCELFAVLHFFNPFMWLLRRDLKLIHEYQADEAVLNKGIDAQKYQLMVLEKAVGERRFAMANHFTQKPILKRLNMMTKTKNRPWGRVKLILFVPIVIVLLQAFARPDLITSADDFIPVKFTENKAEKWLSKWTVDNIGKGIFEPNVNVADLPKAENNVMVILMNTNDQYLVENKRASKENIKWLTASFLQGANIDDGGKAPDMVEKDIPLVGKLNVPTCMVLYQHDIKSSKEAINYTLRQIGKAYLETREAKAFVLFGEKYFDLDEEKQAAVNMAVPVCFSYELPKNPRANVYLPFQGKSSDEYKPFNIVIKNRDEIYVENYKYTSLDAFIESIQSWNKESGNNDHGMGMVSKSYPANLVIDYVMSKEDNKKLELALFRNGIRVKSLKKNQSYRVIEIGAKRERKNKSRYKVPAQAETRDKSKLYVSLYNDEKIDLNEIKQTALECIDTKKSAIIEIEDGIGEKDVNSVKAVLKKCGISDIYVVQLMKNVPETATAVQANQPKKTNQPQEKLPWIRFSEKLIFVNGKECKLSDMNSTLEQVFEDEGTERKVELLVFAASPRGRIAQLLTELNKMNNLEIVQKNYQPQPRPLRYKLYLYPDKIKVNNKVIRMEDVAQLTEEWVEATGKKTAQIHIPEHVSDERIAELKEELRKGGIE